jgi:hypothetical protein
MQAKHVVASTQPVEVRAVRDKQAQEVFLRVPWSLGMKSDPLWVPPLLDDYRRTLDPRKSPFLEHGEIACFTAFQAGQPVGRISAQIDRCFDQQWPSEPGVAYFGFFACKDDVAVARALFAVAEGWARGRGRTRLWGPFTPDPKGECGILIDGFDTPPRIGMAHDKPYLGALVEAAGYHKLKDLFAWWYVANSPIDPITKKLSQRTRELPNVKIRTMDINQLHREVEIIRDVYNAAWSENWGFVPFTAAELALYATEYKHFFDPEIALVAEVDGKPAAICFAIPDVNELVKDFDGELMKRPLNLAKLLWRLKFARPKAARLILLGIKPEFRASRRYGALAAVLYEEVALRGSRRGYVGGELSWTLEDNDAINRGIERMGARKYKTYRLYERVL